MIHVRNLDLFIVGCVYGFALATALPSVQPRLCDTAGGVTLPGVLTGQREGDPAAAGGRLDGVKRQEVQQPARGGAGHEPPVEPRLRHARRRRQAEEVPAAQAPQHRLAAGEFLVPRVSEFLMPRV